MRFLSADSMLYAEGKIKKIKHIFYSLTDQVFGIGAVFLVNLVLARTSSEAEYGEFVIVYSAYMFITSLHNALVLEPYTVFSAGRYLKFFDQYLQFIIRMNFFIVLMLSFILMMITGIVWLWLPVFYTPMFIAVALGLFFLLYGPLFKRVFYVRRNTGLAACMSLAYLIAVSMGLYVLHRVGSLSGFSAFMLISVCWLLVSPIFFRKFQLKKYKPEFINNHKDYWHVHWEYSRWVLATALVFQFVNQGYFWITGFFLGLESVANLKAVQNVILPVNLFFISVSLLVLPLMSSAYQKNSILGIIPILKKLIISFISSAILFLMFIWFLGEPILNFIYSGKYDKSFELLYVIGLTPIFFAIGNAFNDALKSMEQPAWVFKGYLVSGAMTFIIGVPLVLAFGVIGAAWGMVVSAASYSFVLMFGFIRFTKMDKSTAF